MSNELIFDQGKLVRAELDMQIATAKAYPRNPNEFIDLATQLATQDEETVQACIYCLPPRKDSYGKMTEIKGPSIRLAEISAVCWGNLHAGSRIVENDGQSITAEGVAWDLERNVKMISPVKRSITKSNGARYSHDMQTLTGNATSSIALRNAIFKIIPKALVDRVYEKAKQFAVGDQKELSIKRKAIFDRFSQWNVDDKQILRFFQKNSIDEFTQMDLEKLIGIGTAIKENHIEPEQAFILEDEESITSPNIEERINTLLNK